MMAKKVNIIEIGPRDGFQSVKEYIEKETKLEIIEAIIAAGVQKIQCTSFVSPKAIPQMRDAVEITEYLIDKYPERELFALVPNLHGAKAAVAAGLREIAPVISLSKSHNMNNVRRTHEQSIDEVKEMQDLFPNVKIHQDIATAFGCPFEGRMEVSALVDFVGIFHNMGIRDFNICDTIGVAYPAQVREVFTALIKAFPNAEFDVHIHDTRNMGIINSYEALKCGVTNIQTTIAGLGGCPFAPGATGNTATEDLNYMLALEGYESGIDQKKLLDAAKLLRSKVDGNYSGHHISITQCHAMFE